MGMYGIVILNSLVKRVMLGEQIPKTRFSVELRKLFKKYYREERDMLERIKELIAEILTVDADSITEETSFRDDQEADSLDLFELVMAAEEEYGIEIPTEDAENFKTVGDVIRYIEALQN